MRVHLRKILGAWAVIAALLFWNGVLTLGLLKPILGPEAGEMMGAFIAISVIFAASRPLLINEPEPTTADALRVGALWLMLGVIFEVGLGQLAVRYFPRTAPAYGMWDGSFWVLILLSMATAPVTWLRRQPVSIERVTK